MRAMIVSVTGVSSSPVVPMNRNITPFNVGFGVAVTGTINYTVQHTFDDVQSATFNPATATWFNHPTIAAQSANADGNYAFPVRGIRIIGNSGTGTATITILQAGLQ